ncbi:MAG: hypothetical protein AB1641_09915 [Thermodesulfobacteriota bacterium]
MSEKKITLSGQTFAIRPLTRGEVKQLREKGYLSGDLQGEEADLAADVILNVVMGSRALDVDNLPFRDANTIITEILNLTFGNVESEKNS